MTKRFTGLHMLTVMVGCFGVIIAVNLLMAHYALSTFGGTVVDNSYVASQEFNGWLAKARRQKALGWTTSFSLDPARHVGVETSAGEDATVSGVARHPLGRAPDVALGFAALGGGRYRATTVLPGGRWLVHVSIKRGGDEARLIETLG